MLKLLVQVVSEIVDSKHSVSAIDNDETIKTITATEFHLTNGLGVEEQEAHQLVGPGKTPHH